MRLHGTPGSPASWRLRIALRLKGLAAEAVCHDLERGGQRLPGFRRLNPQGMVPVLELPDGHVLTQSLAILEWMEEIWPSPALLPPDPFGRARVRAFAMAIACDVQPLHRPRVMGRLAEAGLSESQRQNWARQAITEGLDACETLLDHGAGPFCFGEAPGLADLCLVPQLHNARQFGVHLAFPRLLAAEAACMTLPAFQDTVPEHLHHAF
jgi:maleylpyruvate isomerase